MGDESDVDVHFQVESWPHRKKTGGQEGEERWMEEGEAEDQLQTACRQALSLWQFR